MIERVDDEKHGDCLRGPLFRFDGKELRTADALKVGPLIAHGYVALARDDSQSLRRIIAFPVRLELDRDPSAGGRWTLTARLRTASSLASDVSEGIRRALEAPERWALVVQEDSEGNYVQAFLREREVAA